jgi:tetratricopeptide (TPR) repeat protein
MDHPNIARIYDGGLTPARQPFFVMELVQGVPLTQYCDQQRLTVRARLELFVAVCQAVQHAHQKGIIHRDLKPGNVLVTEVDGRPTPKVIDFGVAKATEVKLTDMSLADVGAIVGTPTYMSPEQADPSSMDIDTRTDVYALGVMLYELLTGSPPIDAKQFQRGAILEMLRMVREVDPPRPSTKLSTAEALPNIAANRSIEPARLAKLLQGELDWVVMKALEKDRTRRYETANGFARDIQRYLADEVVEARPPSRGYRLKKFVKRNKGQVIAATLVFLTLVAGIVGTSFGMLAARRAQKAEAKQRANAVAQRDKALAAEQQTAIERDKAIAAEQQTAIERDKAIAAEAKTNTINEFLTNDLLTQAEPANNAVEDKVTVVEVLDRAAKKVGTRFADQPELERALRSTIAGTYHGLAFWEKAEAQWRSLLEAAQKRDPESRDSYSDMSSLAHILEHRGRRDAEVLKLAETSAAGLERTLGPDDPDTLAALQILAVVYRDLGKDSEAIALFERIRDAQIGKLGPDHIDTLITLQHLALAYKDLGKLRDAIALFERVRDVQIARLGPDHPHTLVTLNNLAEAYGAVGQVHEAIALYERIRDAWIARLGPDHTNTLTMLNNLAEAYLAAGKLPDAIALFERVKGAQTARLGPDHPDTLTTLNNLALAYEKTGKLRDAIALFERVKDAWITQLGPDHPKTLTTLNNLAGAYTAGGRLGEGIALYERVRNAQTARLGPDHPNTLTTLNNLAATYWSTGALDRSVPLFEEVLKREEAKLGREHPLTQQTAANLGVNYKDAGRIDKAIPLLEEAYRARGRSPKLRPYGGPLLDAYTKAGRSAEAVKLAHEFLADARKTTPKDSPQLAAAMATVSPALLQVKAYAEAESLLRECLAIREKNDPNGWTTFNSKVQLGAALLGQKKYTEAEAVLVAGYEGMTQREATMPPQAKDRLLEAIERLVQLYEATAKPNEAARWRKKLDARNTVGKPAEKKP